MTEPHRIPQTKAELMSAIEREWNLLLDLIEKLDPQKLIQADLTGWSPKDNLAHLTEWMKILMGFYMDLRRAHEVMGVDPEVTQAWSFEARNQLLFERNRQRTSEAVLAELKRVYTELVARLDAMSFDDLLKPQHPFDPEKRPLLLYVLRATSEHFAEHRERIQTNLGRG